MLGRALRSILPIATLTSRSPTLAARKRASRRRPQTTPASRHLASALAARWMGEAQEPAGSAGQGLAVPAGVRSGKASLAEHGAARSNRRSTWSPPCTTPTSLDPPLFAESAQTSQRLLRLRSPSPPLWPPRRRLKPALTLQNLLMQVRTHPDHQPASVSMLHEHHADLRPGSLPCRRGDPDALLRSRYDGSDGHPRPHQSAQGDPNA